MIEIKNGAHLYQVGERVAETDKYRIYFCTQVETGRRCLFQITTAVEYNGGLERAAYILGELKRLADEREAEYAKVKKDPKVLLNYSLGFPELLDSFVGQEQGGRRISILAFRKVDDASDMVPLINITEKDHLRVDLRTSAWIMGKLLKMLAFAHGEEISVGLTNDRNILIEPNQHFVLIFDWSAALMVTATTEMRRQEISQAAQAVIIALGGNLATGAIPDDGEEAFEQYTDFLWRLARGKESNAERARAKFYELIDKLWERKFYPFTAKPLE